MNEQTIDPMKAMADAQEDAPNTGLTRFALKEGNSFLVTNGLGDIAGFADGFFRDDTRLLSRFVLRIGGQRPMLLGAALSHDDVVFEANLTNALFSLDDGREITQGTVYVNRTRYLWRHRMHERLAVTNYGTSALRLPLSLEIAADFRDIFEVRGYRRAQRGQRDAPEIGKDFLRFGYHERGGLEKSLHIGFSQPADDVRDDGEIGFTLNIPRGATRVLYVEADNAPAAPTRTRHRQHRAAAHRKMKSKRQRGASVYSSGPLFNDWLNRTRADIALLTTDLATGPYPYAGIPWFSTVFGRDGIVTALELLWLEPGLARGVLRLLAETQAKTRDAYSEAEPGKILHEMRKGEMSRLEEVPFARYYGGVDTTPLFVHLAAEYARRTGDDALIGELWPALRAAIDWIETHRAAHPRGLVAYESSKTGGLRNQGWKDSADSIFHADGSLAEGPITLVDVQGHVFLALRGMARLADRRGEAEYAAELREKAEDVRARVERHFWIEDGGFYALALDGDNRPCAVRTSNVGQLLYSGLPAPERGRAAAEAMFKPDMYSGWGFRTVAKGEPRYNPMSYHNGSVWPHDTAICAAGIMRYAHRDCAPDILTRLFDAALQFGKSLPELFCGFPRVAGEAPVAYPVACLPQAWASGSVFLLLKACLGIEIDAHARKIAITNPSLPAGIDQLTVRDLEIAGTTVTLEFTRENDQVSCVAQHPSDSDIELVVQDDI